MGLWHPDTIDGMVAHQIAACPNCEPDRRPRMSVCDYHEGWLAAIEGLEGHAVLDGEAVKIAAITYVHDRLRRADLVPVEAES